MGVKKSTEVQEDGAAAEVVSAPEPTIQLELLAHSRYVVDSQLYEKDTVYELAEPAAKALLRVRTDDGRPVFARYEEDEQVPAPKAATREVRTVTKVVAPTPVVPAATEETPSTPKVIKVGDDAELVAEGILTPDATGEETAL